MTISAGNGSGRAGPARLRVNRAQVGDRPVHRQRADAAGRARTRRAARARTPWRGRRRCCRRGPGAARSASDRNVSSPVSAASTVSSDVVQPQRVHRPPVLVRGQAERERDVHQAQRGLDVQVEQAPGAGLRIDLRDVEHAEVETRPRHRPPAAPGTPGAAESEQHPVDVQVVLDHRAVAEIRQRDRAQADRRGGRAAAFRSAEVQQVRLHDEVPDQQGDGVRGDEPAQEPQAQPVHRGVRGEPDRAGPLADDDQRDGHPGQRPASTGRAGRGWGAAGR